MNVKISELENLNTIRPSDKLVINHDGTTFQGSLDTIIGGYLNSARYISYNDLFSSGGISGYLDSYITSEYLSEYCSNYITSEYCSSYITSEYLSGYLSSYCSGYITSEYLSEYCSSYITSDYLSSYLSEYITTENLSDYLSDYTLSSYLSDYLSDYLSNGHYMTYDDAENFATFMNSGYLSNDSNTYIIYKAISSYFNT